MKFNKMLLSVLLVCVSQAQSMNYVKESLKSAKDKVSLASFLASFWWSRLSNNQKVASKIIATTAALYAAKKMVDSLSVQEESKKDSEFSVPTQEESKRCDEALDYFTTQKPQMFNSQQAKADEPVLEHKNQEQSKLNQLLRSFPGLGLMLIDINVTHGMVNASKVIIKKKRVTIQFDSGSASRIIVIKQKENDDFSYELVSDDTICHG